METEYIKKKSEILKAIIETYQNNNTIGFINKQIANILSVSIPNMRIVGEDLIIEYKDITKRLLEKCNQEKIFYLEYIILNIQQHLDPNFQYFTKKEYEGYTEILMSKGSNLNCEIVAAVSSEVS